ncbi:endocellulase [Armillaria luteobubalina]|uniref:Endocellulase n=1 Tax=Armillaria luteobubalina TaxID=153913 RepID=A0AA39UMY5_9AGAR|nr:endocellulase [Armillaria luteobubalina]
MLTSSLLVLSALAAVASCQTLSGQYDCTTGGEYSLCQNLWGKNSGVGSQTSTLISTSGNNISWTTTWNWQNNPNNVKSYANVLSATSKGKQLAAITHAPTTWNWSYLSESSGIRADVSYDIWFGVAPSGTAATTSSSYEIMIWLSGLGGIQPVGSQITSNTAVAGHTWNVWRGPNANWQVISFVATSEIRDFNVDLKDFFNYLVAQQGVPSTQYVQAIQSGTEPFTGSAQLMTTSYSVSLS